MKLTANYSRVGTTPWTKEDYGNDVSYLFQTRTTKVPQQYEVEFNLTQDDTWHFQFYLRGENGARYHRPTNTGGATEVFRAVKTALLDFLNTKHPDKVYATYKDERISLYRRLFNDIPGWFTQHGPSELGTEDPQTLTITPSHT